MIEVLLATHNGAEYLPEQLDSILAQTCRDFRILIQDDGSTDRTPGVIADYLDRFPEKIRQICPDAAPGGAAANFLTLTQHAREEYVMFCDQDDVWLPEKMERMLSAMTELEAAYGKEVPCLVFSAVKAVDRDLRPLEETRSVAVRTEFRQLLVSNCVNGCAAMCNRSLYELLGTYDERILMHDWWAAQAAAALGRIAYVPQALTLYRQHGGNAVGQARSSDLGFWLRRMKKEDPFEKKRGYYRQAALLKLRLGDRMDRQTGETLDAFLAIPEYRSKLRRIAAIRRGGFQKGDPLTQLLFLLTI